MSGESSMFSSSPETFLYGGSYIPSTNSRGGNLLPGGQYTPQGPYLQGQYPMPRPQPIQG